MKFISLYLFLFNTITIFGLKNSASEECKSLSDFFKNHLESGSQLEIPECCESEDSICENGHITELKFCWGNYIESVDFSKFPKLPKLKKLLIEGRVFKNDKIPKRLFELPSLEQLNVTHAFTTSQPEIPEDCSLQYLNLYKNSIKGFPSSIINCSKLKFLDLAHNKIGIIPEDISLLNDLEYLYIGATNLTSLSGKIFNLKLKEFDLDGNPYLSTKIYNFGRQVDQCDLRDTKIICYERGTCKTLVKSENPHELYSDPESVYPNKCESHDSFESNEDNNNNTKPKNVPLYIIIALLAIIIIILCVIFYTIKKNHKKKLKNEIKPDIVVSPLITVSPTTDLKNLKSNDHNSIILAYNDMIRNSIISTINNNDSINCIDMNVPKNRNDSYISQSSNTIELKKKRTNSIDKIKNLLVSTNVNNTNNENILASPSTSSYSNGLPSSSSNCHNVIPLISSGEQGTTRDSKYLEALQGSLDNSKNTDDLPSYTDMPSFTDFNNYDDSNNNIQTGQIFVNNIIPNPIPEISKTFNSSLPPYSAFPCKLSEINEDENETDSNKNKDNESN